MSNILGLTPINVAEDRDELGRERDHITEGVDSLTETVQPASPTPTPTERAAPVAPSTPADSSIPGLTRQEADAPVRSNLDGLSPVPVQRNNIDGLTRVNTVNPIDPLLPVGVVPGEYSSDDLVEDKYYSAVHEGVMDRYGVQAVEGLSREDVVARWLNNRVGVGVAVNSARVLSETAYMMDVVKSEDRDRMQKMATSYALYEAMAGIGSDETSWGEAGATAWRTVRSTILDPVNLLSLGVGKVAGGVTVKAGVRVMEAAILAEARDRLATGASKAAVSALSKDIGRRAQAVALRSGTDDVARYAANMASSSAGRKILDRAGLREIGAVAMTDALTGSGLEYLYQDQLVQAGVQEEVNPYAVGLAAVASLAMGGVAAVRVGTRGMSGTALVGEELGPISHKRVADGLAQAMRDNYSQLMDNGTTWASKVDAGKEMDVQDTDFFVEMLLGVSDANGEVQLKGLGQLMAEEGFYFVKKDETHKASDFIAEFMAEMEPDDVTNLVEAFESSTGVKLKGLREFTDENGVMTVLDSVSPQTFSQAFARKMSNGGRTLESVSRFARMTGQSIKDLDINELAGFSLGMGLLKKDVVKGGNRLTKAIAAGQNRYIRALVSHPATSFINVLGWGASTTLGSANDLVRGVLHLGTGGLKKVAGYGDKGLANTNFGKAMLLANVQKIKFLLDPDQSYAAFKSSLNTHGDSLKRVQQAQSGGIDVSSSVDDVLGRTETGQVSEKYLSRIQQLTFVEAQDSLTKSVEYLYQMEKGIRSVFGVSYNDFYKQADVRSIMATKEYKQMLEGTMDRIQEHTFSKSYKSKGGIVGEIAGVLEDARNVPGLGMMVPFGRFFNNTIDFTVKNTPVLGNVLKLAGKYPDKTHGELVLQGMIAGGLVTTMAANETEKRNQGLGMYDSIDPLTGQVVNQKYDYPLSLFIAAGRYMSYITNGEQPPKEVVAAMVKDFGIGGLTRNLSTTAGLLADSLIALMGGEVDTAKAKGGEAFSSVGAQAFAGITRSFEPIDQVLGLVMGTDMAPQNVKDGNAYLGKSLTYFSHLAEALTGEPFNEALVSSSEGERDPKLAGVMGIRTVHHTNVLRVMNMLGYDSWKYDGDYITSKLVAGASNEYKRMMFEELERTASSLMSSSEWRSSSTEARRQAWEAVVGQIEDTARYRLATEYTGAESTFLPLVELTEKYSEAVIREGMRDSGLEGDLGDLTYGQITLLKSTMDTTKYVEEVSQEYFIDVK